MTQQEFIKRAYSDIPSAVYELYAAGQISAADLTPAQRRHMELYQLYSKCRDNPALWYFDPDKTADIEGRITALQALADGASVADSGIEQYLDTPDRDDDETTRTIWD